ncbi:hypothetical protein HDA40_001892 [Hamadaea flava]|uniref:Uncharacterized protein n=1 Tax=Hamadaea flava TaxID=1742688 RepID=A0ABV8LEC8_9ACTN|nr:hypothetical protein [Hamadaea flava]MCP2323385.1 hypothetical protein [Hamadaea flava]
MRKYDVPAPLFHLLVGAFLAKEADWLLSAGSYRPGTAVHPGDPFGTVVSWLWMHHPDELMAHLADYMDRLRSTSPHLEGWEGPRVALDDVLRGLPLAVPAGFTDDETTALISAMAGEIPKRLSEDPNLP